MSSIRPCRDDERPAILAIVNAAAEAYRGVIPADRWREPYMPADELDAEIAAGVAFWGYEADGELAGIMGIQPVRDVELIRHAYTAPARQGRGIGGALLEHLAEPQHAAAARRHVGGRRVGDPLLRRHGFERCRRSGGRSCCASTGRSRSGRWRRRWCWWGRPPR